MSGLILTISWQYALGFTGMGLLVLAWVPQTLATLRSRRCPLDTKFIILYVLASTLLTIYALIIGDVVFTVLNLLAALQSAINLFVKLRWG